MQIRPYNDSTDRSAVIRLWEKVFSSHLTGRNEPNGSIDRKLAMEDGLFFVAVDLDDSIAGTIMAGYDGHRGWLYSVASDPQQRGRGIGRMLVDHAVNALKQLGCPKVNLQVRGTNLGVIDFYKKLGFTEDNCVSLGKTLD